MGVESSVRILSNRTATVKYTEEKIVKIVDGMEDTGAMK